MNETTTKAKVIRSMLGTSYRDEQGWPWEPLANPRTGGKIPVRQVNDSIKDRSCLLTGTFLADGPDSGVITIDPISPIDAEAIVREMMAQTP